MLARRTPEAFVPASRAVARATKSGEHLDRPAEPILANSFEVPRGDGDVDPARGRIGSASSALPQTCPTPSPSRRPVALRQLLFLARRPSRK